MIEQLVKNLITRKLNPEQRLALRLNRENGLLRIERLRGLRMGTILKDQTRELALKVYRNAMIIEVLMRRHCARPCYKSL